MSTNRVLVGKIATGVYGLKIAKEGVDVTTAKTYDLLFDSSIHRTGVIYAGGLRSPGTSGTAINFKVNKAELSYIPLVVYNEDATGQRDGNINNESDWVDRINFHKFTKTTITPMYMEHDLNSSYSTNTKAATAGRSTDYSNSNCTNLSFRVLRIPCAYGYMTSANFTASGSTNRVLIGKNVNTNQGYSTSSPGRGIYVSRPGKDVLTCSSDDLIFSTDTGKTSTDFIAKGLYQAMPVAYSNNVPTAVAQVTAVSSGASVNVTNFYGSLSGVFANPVTPGASTGGTASAGSGNATGGSGTSTPAISTSFGTFSSGVTPINFTASTSTVLNFSVLPTFSSLDIF